MRSIESKWHSWSPSVSFSFSSSFLFILSGFIFISTFRYKNKPNCLCLKRLVLIVIGIATILCNEISSGILMTRWTSSQLKVLSLEKVRLNYLGLYLLILLFYSNKRINDYNLEMIFLCVQKGGEEEEGQVRNFLSLFIYFLAWSRSFWLPIKL